MKRDLIEKLAALAKKAKGTEKNAQGEMPPGMGMDPMAGGGGGMGMDPAMMGGPPMGAQPVPTAEDIMAMQGGGMPMDPAMMGGAPAGDPAMMGMDPAMMGAPIEPAPVGPSPEELAVDLANAEALASMGKAVQGLTDVMAKDQASTAATMVNAADAIVSSPVGDELVADDIGPLMEGDAI